MRAHTPPRPHHPYRPHPTWPVSSPLPTPGSQSLKAANACPHPPAPSPPPAPTPHPTPTSPLPTPGSHVLNTLPVRAHTPRPPPPHPTPASPRALGLAMRAHTPPRPHHPHLATPTPGCIFRVWGVFRGCQCVPTPPRALTTPIARTPPGPRFLATTHTWLAFPKCFESLYRLPMRAHTPPRPHHPQRPHPIPPRPRHYPHLARMS